MEAPKGISLLFLVTQTSQGPGEAFGSFFGKSQNPTILAKPYGTPMVPLCPTPPPIGPGGETAGYGPPSPGFHMLPAPVLLRESGKGGMAGIDGMDGRDDGMDRRGGDGMERIDGMGWDGTGRDGTEWEGWDG